MRWVLHLVFVSQGGRHDSVLVVMDQDDPLPGAHGHFPIGGHACLFEELMEQSIGLIRVVRNEGLGSSIVVTVIAWKKLTNLSSSINSIFRGLLVFWKDDPGLTDFHTVLRFIDVKHSIYRKISSSR
jgi:hypothetical protein